jgi:hypothetical protein
MSNYNNHNLQNALQEFKGWCSTKGIDPHTFVSETLYLQTTPNRNTSQDFQLEGLNKLSKIATTLKNEAQAVVEVSVASDNKILNTSQTFAELYAKKDKSPIEQKLIDSVDAHLSETEKNAAISSKKPVSAVIEQVNMIVQKLVQQAEQMLQAEKHKEKEESKEKERLQPSKDDKMHGLGDEYGIADAIVKSIRERANALSESHQQIKTPSGKARFEVVDSSQISSKNMNIDRNNIAEKEKGQGVQKS